MSSRHKLVKTDVPGVFERGPKYAYTWRDRYGKQRWGTARTKRAAKDAKRAEEEKVARGEDFAPTKLSFGEYAEEWIDSYTGRTQHGFTETARDRYRDTLRRLKRYFDVERGLPLAAIAPRDVKACFAWLAEQENERKPGQLLARSSIVKHKTTLGAMLADAVEDGLIRTNPATGVRVVAPDGGDSGRPEAKDVRGMTQKELGELLAALPDRWLVFFELLAKTGLRWGEAIELRWGRDITFGAKPQLHVNWQVNKAGKVVRPKGKSRRTIPLSKGLAQKLWKMQGDHGKLVFANGAGNHLSRNNHYRDVLRPAAEAAGLDWVTFHTFRHTCASLLFAEGRNIKQVQEWLGHFDPGFTLRTYVHLLDDGVGDPDFLDGLVVPADPKDAEDEDDQGEGRSAANG